VVAAAPKKNIKSNSERPKFSELFIFYFIFLGLFLASLPLAKEKVKVVLDGRRGGWGRLGVGGRLGGRLGPPPRGQGGRREEVGIRGSLGLRVVGGLYCWSTRRRDQRRRQVVIGDRGGR
jgi:hypothetical protein